MVGAGNAWAVAPLPHDLQRLRREQRGELGNGARNVLDVVGLHH